MKTTCFSDDTFIKYISGNLSVRKTRKIKQHIKKCRDCREAIQISYESLKSPVLKEIEPVSRAEAQKYLFFLQPRISRKVKIRSQMKKLNKQFGKKFTFFKETMHEKMNDVTKWMLSSTPEPALAYIKRRKNDDMSTIKITKFSIEGLQIRILVEKENENDTFFLDIEIPDRQDVDIFRISLKDSSGGKSSKPLKGKSVSFKGISAGNYELDINRNQYSMKNKAFTLNEKGQIYVR
jgi:hypothetical protein